MSWGRKSKKKPSVLINLYFLVNFIRQTGPMVTMVTSCTVTLFQLPVVEMSWGKKSKRKLSVVKVGSCSSLLQSLNSTLKVSIRWEKEQFWHYNLNAPPTWNFSKLIEGRYSLSTSSHSEQKEQSLLNLCSSLIPKCSHTLQSFYKISNLK